MRLRELFEDGRIVKGVNTTVDVGPNEIPIQAAKFGNKVDKDGRPPTLSKKVKGSSTNVLFNLGLSESKNISEREDPNHGFPEPIQIIQRVNPGDTVYSIAREYGVTPQDIQRVNNLDRNFTIRPGQELGIPRARSRQQPTQQSRQQPRNSQKTLTGKPFESLLTREARNGGITNPVELAAFLSQCYVETGEFNALRERGNRKYIERMYDPKYNPVGAEEIGNTKIGDGWKFRGRGFIQLTGRYNYTRAGKELGIDLVNNPDLVMKPKIAALTSVWYWKWMVRRKVKNFNDVVAVTLAVNGGRAGLNKRKEAFVDFKKFKLQKDAVA